MKNTNNNKGILYLILVVNGLYLVISFIAYLIKMSTYPISANIIDFLYFIPYLAIGILISVGLTLYFYKKYDRQNIDIIEKSKIFLLVNLPKYFKKAPSSRIYSVCRKWGMN